MSATASAQPTGTASWVSSPRAFLAPLALAQFICSFAGSNMNVMINDISHDLHTDVKGIQTAITLFLLIMAVLMIPCSKLTDRCERFAHIDDTKKSPRLTATRTSRRPGSSPGTTAVSSPGRTGGCSATAQAAPRFCSSIEKRKRDPV